MTCSKASLRLSSFVGVWDHVTSARVPISNTQNNLSDTVPGESPWSRLPLLVGQDVLFLLPLSLAALEKMKAWIGQHSLHGIAA